MGDPAFFMLGKDGEAIQRRRKAMIRRGMAAILLLTTSAWANEPVPAIKDNVDISGLLSEGKKPCDEDKKKAEAAAAEAKKVEAGLQGLLGTPPAEKKPEPAQKGLGAVPAMGNCT
jgi:hypothetical protein